MMSKKVERSESSVLIRDFEGMLVHSGWWGVKLLMDTDTSRLLWFFADAQGIC